MSRVINLTAAAALVLSSQTLVRAAYECRNLDRPANPKPRKLHAFKSGKGRL